ncbi:9775_t:CDS:1, partial [Cetraspora pellucida]
MAILYFQIAIYDAKNLKQVILPILLSDISKIVLITYDELVFYANDSFTKAWGPIEEDKLCHKSQVLSVHVSDFD